MQHITTLMPGSVAAIPMDVPTIAEKLRDRGYRTHAVGKWHLGAARWVNTPIGRGFDTYQGYLQGAVDYYTKEVGLGTLGSKIPFVTAASTGFDYWVNKNAMWEESNSTGHPGHYETDLQKDELKKIIDAHNTSEPFFLYLAHQNIHEPLQMPPQPKYSENCAHVLPSASGKDRHVLCAMANRMDDSIGDLEIYLKEKGMWNNTLIWVTTDNGGMLPPGVGGGKAGSASSNFPLRSGKTSLFQGGVRGVCFVTGGVVPMMARGNVVNGLIQHLDIPTTLGALAGVNISDTADGFDMWGVVASGHESPRDEVPLNVDVGTLQRLLGAATGSCCGGSLGVPSYSGLIQGNWKLISGWSGAYDGWSTNDPYTLVAPNTSQSDIQKVDGKQVWLFDLSSDPRELNNLATTRKDVVRSLQSRLAELSDEAKGYMPAQMNVPHARSLPILHNGSWAPYLKDSERREITSTGRLELFGYVGDNRYEFLAAHDELVVV